MRRKVIILVLSCIFSLQGTLCYSQQGGLDFYGDTLGVPLPRMRNMEAPLSESSVSSFFLQADIKAYEETARRLLAFKKERQLDDWLYYQLIRKAAQALSPKEADYYTYTLYKCLLLNLSGYSSRVAVSGSYMLLYIQSDEVVYDIPFRTEGGRQFVCLNYHDYGSIDFEKNRFSLLLFAPEGGTSFSYRINRMPSFSGMAYQEKPLRFTYDGKDYEFRIKLSPSIRQIFANYPVAEFESHFNMPLSSQTYNSLIPTLKKAVRGLSQENGVDYLMQFTRTAFAYKPDRELYGKEKRLSPEQTLLFDQSDCEDRASLFFYLVREIYNLPMIVVSYPEHVTVAIRFNKVYGRPVMYNGNAYSICEPTPQKYDLKLGEGLPELRNTPFEITYAYSPLK